MPSRHALLTALLAVAVVLVPAHVLAEAPPDQASPTPGSSHPATPIQPPPTAETPEQTPSATATGPPIATATPTPTEAPSPAESPAGDTALPTSAPVSPTPESPPASPTAVPSPLPSAGPDPSPGGPEPTPDETVGYVVTFATRADFDARAEFAVAHGVDEEAAVPELRIATVRVPRADAVAALSAMRADSRALRVEPDREREVGGVPSDPLYAEQWALARIGWPAVASEPPEGEAVVAVLDTGVDASHPDLGGQLVPGASFVDGADAWTDPHGHGTWMAGIVAAASDNDEGIAGAGLGALRVMPVTVIGADGRGRDSHIIAGLVHAVDSGADVVLMAFWSSAYSEALQAAVDYAWDHDVVVVAAAGNDGPATAAYPAGHAGVVGVAATQPDDTLWAWSNTDSAVFIAAPGAAITTTDVGGAYREISGTSPAAAYVAAGAALLRAADATLANGVVVGRLARTAAAVGEREQTGNGLLDLARAWRDTTTEPIRPNGARQADGGPFVGPYTDPADPSTEPVYTVAASPTFRSSTDSAIGSGATSLVLGRPSGTTAGDTLVATISVRPSTATIAAPSGWTLIRRVDQTTGTTNSIAAYYRVATASEPTSYTWTIGNAPTGAAGGIMAFYNASTCAPIDVHAGSATASSLSHAAPSVTTTQSGGMLIAAHGFASSATWSTPTGMTEAIDVASELVPNSGGVAIAASYQLLGAAGATGTRTATASNDADTGATLSVALRSSCTRTWDGGGGTTSWGTAANWSPDGVPTASDDVSLTGANTINVNVAASTNDLTLNNTSLILTINASQSLTVTGNLTVTNGTLNTQAGFPTVSGTTSLAATSTVGYTGSGSQTVAALAYGNLVSSSGTNTLAGNVSAAGNLTISGGTLDLSGFTANRTSAGGTLTVSNGATLKVGGAARTLPSNYSTHSIGSTSTIEYGGTTTNVAGLNSGQSYGNLVISGSAVAGTSSYAVAGTMTVSGTYTPGASVVVSGAGTLTGTGTVRVTRTSATAGFSNQYTITNKTLTNLTVEYAGTAAQVVSALAYGNLAVNNATGVTLAGNASVSGTLTLASGLITTGASTLSVGASGSVARASGHVVGNLQRAIGTGAPSVTFQIGDATTYAPVTVAFASVTTAGTLTASTSAGDHAQLASSAINPARSVNRTWTLTGSGVVFTTYDATVTFVAGDVDAGASTGSFIVARFASSSWTTASPGARTPTSTQGTALTGFGTLAAGMPDLGIFSDDLDIGGPSLAGAASHSGGTYSVSGSGADIWGTADQFNFLYLAKTGDVRITARVVSLTNTDPWAKAGVMIRETSDAGSMHAFAAITPSNGMAFQWRPTASGTSLNSNQTGFSAPYWVRVTRSGNDLIAERSADGVNWVQQGTTQTIAMTSTVSVGLAITSHNNGALATAVFDNVSVTSAPTAVADVYATRASSGLSVAAASGVLANDSDPENDALTASLVTTTANGSLTLNANGSFSYTPTAGWMGIDTFTYRAFDGQVYSASVTVSIYVIGSVGFQAEDYVSGTATGAGFTTASEASALGGEAIFTNGDNTNAAGPPTERVRYDVAFPDAGATNTYHLYVRYRMAVDQTLDDSGWVLTPLDADAAVGGSWDQINDLVNHGDTTYQWVDLAATSGINGVPAYSNVSAGLHSWWFGGRENGLYVDAFVFATMASLDTTSVGRSFLDLAVNDRPSAVNDSYTVNEDATLNIAASGVLGNDTDPEGDSLTAALVSTTSNGTLTLNANGSFTYAPGSSFFGTDSFTYRARDSMATSSSAATVTITVNSVNDAPSFTKGANQSVNEDAGAQTVAGWATAISAGPANEAGQTVSFLVTNNNNSLFSAQPAISATGTLTYTPAANASGSATVTVRIQDNGGTANGGVDTSAAQTFAIGVTAVNDAPVNSVPGAQATAVNMPITFSAAGGNQVSISDVDAAASTVRVQLTGSNGTLTLSGTAGLTFSVGDGTADATMTFTGTVSAINAALNGLTFTPASQFTGTASVQIVANDQGATGSGGAQSDTDSVSISVTNTAPTGTADSYTVSQGNALVVAAPGVLTNDTDPNGGQTLTVQSPRPVSAPSSGTLTLNADGSFTYTPTAGFTGTDSFTYRVTDGIADSAITTVTISVATTAYVSGAAWSTAFAANRYLDLTFPAYLPSGANVTGATFRHSYRSYAGGTTCFYVEVWSAGSLIGSHGSSASPVSCSSGTGFVADELELPEVNSAARANAVTVRVFVRNSAGGRSEHNLAELAVSYWLGNP